MLYTYADVYAGLDERKILLAYCKLKVAATDDVGGGVLGSPVELILRH